MNEGQPGAGLKSRELAGIGQENLKKGLERA
jgi:hypothetical protein